MWYLELLILTFIILQTTHMHVHCQINKNVFITADNLANNNNEYNVSLTSNSTTTKTGSSNFWINVVSQYGSDLRVSLGPSFGFHAAFPSSIQLIINGSTPNHTVYGEGNILFVFSVSNNKYFSTMTNLHNTPIQFQIYPSNNHPLASTNVNNMIYTSTPNRNIRYIEGNVWSMTPSILYNTSLQWPICITITNNPIQNTVTYQWKDVINPVMYNTSFAPISGLNMDISGDNPNLKFIISSINISYIVKESSPITTIYHRTSDLLSTFAQNTEITLKNDSSDRESNILMGLDVYITYIIIAVIFICCFLCFVCGICIGITYYKRKLVNNEKDSDVDHEAAELKKQLSGNDQFSMPYNNAETEEIVTAFSTNRINMNESDGSHESLYLAGDVFEKNDERLDLTPQTSGQRGNNNNNNNEMHVRTETGEADILLKQKTLSNIIDNSTYKNIKVDYNVTDNNIYSD